ncbi:HK97-gp10 family putative phage morphogenesis protein [Sphingobacterium lactis]|uniref:Phage protein, HK97 gp10 family n=1 Tax=Sphingobacterium lactis TaxID=797291 RepID=A0A1H6CS62_9SPHI|nr:hypothetical protein [Sphingobacterium lactis]SEG75841.1 hypothetical protein SAMN05421877_11949 [Sphingobacterium lactis]
MAKGAIINTIGKDLEKYRNDIVKKAKDLVGEYASELEDKATRGAPNFIRIQKEAFNGGLKAEVGPEGNDPLAAYIEFGTGLSAKEILAPYPQWIKDIAWKYKRPEDGTLKGKPYLYNNYLALMPGYQKRFKELVDKKYKS